MIEQEKENLLIRQNELNQEIESQKEQISKFSDNVSVLEQQKSKISAQNEELSQILSVKTGEIEQYQN